MDQHSWCDTWIFIGILLTDLYLICVHKDMCIWETYNKKLKMVEVKKDL